MESAEVSSDISCTNVLFTSNKELKAVNKQELLL